MVIIKIMMSHNALHVIHLSVNNRNVELEKLCVSRRAPVSERKSYERTSKLGSQHCRTCLMSNYVRETNFSKLRPV